MLRTLSTLRIGRQAELTPERHSPGKMAVLSDWTPVYSFAEAAMRASEAVFFYAESRACYAIADLCGSGQVAGVASLFDVLAGRRVVVRPRSGGTGARR